MIDMSSRTARVAVTAGLVSALTLGGGAITALAEVSKADVPAVTAEQVSAATPVEDNTPAPAAEVSKDQAVASVTSKNGTVKNYDSFQEALNNAKSGNDVAADGDTVTLLKDSDESVTVEKRITVTAENKGILYKGTMTVKHGAAIQGIHFVIDDNVAGKGTNSSLTVDGGNGTTSGAAGISNNIFEITADKTRGQFSSITITNGAERTQITDNEFKLSSRVNGSHWYGISIMGSTSRAANYVVVNQNSVSITGTAPKEGEDPYAMPTAYFLYAEGGMPGDGYGVTNLKVTNNTVVAKTTDSAGNPTNQGGQALSIQGVNGLRLTDNTFTGLYSAVMPGAISTQNLKSDNIITGNNDMADTYVDVYVPNAAAAAGYIGTNGIVRENEEKTPADNTFLVAGLEDRTALYSKTVGKDSVAENGTGNRLYHSVKNAINGATDKSSADQPTETVVLYGDSDNENATVSNNSKQVILKLNGKTITAGNYGNAALTVANGGKLIIDEPADGSGAVRQDNKGLSALEVLDGGELTIKGGYYTGTIQAAGGDKADVHIEGGYFSEEPNAAWVADGKGFAQVEENGAKWWKVTDAVLEAKSAAQDIDVETLTVGDDEGAFKSKFIEQAAKVNVNGYTIDFNDETSNKAFEGIIAAVRNKTFNTSFEVTYKATKNSTGAAIEDGGADATVTVTYNLKSTKNQDPDSILDKVDEALKNTASKPQDVVKNLQDAKDAFDKACSDKPTTQQAVSDAYDKLKDALDTFNKPTPGGGGSVAPTPKTYTVTFDDGVSHTADLTEKVTSGSKVAKPADPTLEGYVFKGWFADAALTDAYDFDSPVTGDLTLFAKWALATTDPLTFTDVDPKAWYVPGVDFVSSHGLMLGYGDTGLFGVGKQLTRGELAVILARLAAPGYGPEDFRDAKNETGFSDVADGRFYTWAANWAVENGVINGYGGPDGSRTGFGPDDPVTMEQLVAIIANLADKEGPDKADAGVLAKFRDPLSVSPWATQSVAWAVERGLINGSGENGGLYLHGSADIMRERVAAILMNAFHNGILSFE